MTQLTLTLFIIKNEATRERPFLVMGAYRKDAFPIQERAARFSRVVGVPYSEALFIVHTLDEMVDPSVFPRKSCLNSELLRLYEDDDDYICNK